MKRHLRLSDAAIAVLRDAIGSITQHAVDCAAELAAARAELIAARRDRDDWKRQAMALADRNAELRDDVASRDMHPQGRIGSEPLIGGGDV